MRNAVRFFKVSAISLVVASFCMAQARPAVEMTLDDFRTYFAALHIKEADARGVSAQMDGMKAQLPPWWPEPVAKEMLQSMLDVDLPPIEFPFVKSCMTSSDLKALMVLFQTPEGQRYVDGMTGFMVKQEATGVDAVEAKRQAVQRDQGLPPAALNRLPAEQRKQVVALLQGPAMSCMNDGFHRASTAVGEERTKVVRKVVEDHHADLQAAKAKYEAPTAKPKE